MDLLAEAEESLLPVLLHPRLIHVYALVERVGNERVGQETKLVASASLSQV